MITGHTLKINMNIKIYQAFYQPNQQIALENSWIPYNNEQGDQKYLEYKMWEKVYEENKNKNLHYGVLSWRWREKTFLPSELFDQWILSEPDYDVYFINPFIEILYFNNTWCQGEVHHPGMLNFINRLSYLMGYKINFSQFEYKTDEFSTCHYFIGNDKFWSSYFKFLKEIIDIVKNDFVLNRFMFEDIILYRMREYINFPFIVERLFSLFLILNQDIKYKKYPYESFCYKSRIGDPYEQFLSLYYHKKQRNTLIEESRKLILQKGN